MEIRIIEEFLGKTFVDIKQIDNEQLLFTTSDGEIFEMYHNQDCCENVEINDVVGDIKDLIGSPILKAEERIQSSEDEGVEHTGDESFTWTFYHLATIKGYVDIRWYGCSNGYYSESVDILKR